MFEQSVLGEMDLVLLEYLHCTEVFYRMYRKKYLGRFYLSDTLIVDKNIEVFNNAVTPSRLRIDIDLGYS